MKQFWIIWNPAYHMPTKKRYDTRSEAITVATRMAQQFPGEQFIVMAADCVATIPTCPILQYVEKGPVFRS